MKIGAPGTWDRAMHWALNSVSLPGMQLTGKARWNLVAPIRRQGFHIIPAQVHKPYGRSTHTAAYLSHIVIGVLMVWQNGILVGSQAIWRCGSRTLHFYLLDEPDSIVCPACKIERLGPRVRRHK